MQVYARRISGRHRVGVVPRLDLHLPAPLRCCACSAVQVLPAVPEHVLRSVACGPALDTKDTERARTGHGPCARERERDASFAEGETSLPLALPKERCQLSCTLTL